MKSIYISTLIVLILNLSSCKESNKNNLSQQKNDSLSTLAKDSITSISNNINLEPVKKEVPHFNNKDVNEIVEKTKKYFEDVALATKNNEFDKMIELQMKATDIDNDIQKAKNKLTIKEQKKLIDWYNKLVKAASE